MALLRSTWTLTKKNLLVQQRRWFFTFLRAFLAPILFMFIISYAKNFFVPPSQFGIGHPTAIRSLAQALRASSGNRDKVVFVNNGFTGGDIQAVIESVSAEVARAGKTAEVVQRDVELLTSCASSLRGATACYGAVVFHSSPTEGGGGGAGSGPGAWNYTLRADGVFGERIFTDRTDNDVELYVLPLQRAVDAAIGAVAAAASTPPPTRVIDEYPFTDLTADERDAEIRRLYMGALVDILAVAYFIGVCGVTYQLTGQMASERELGVSQLVEVMTPAARGWHTQAARLLSMHLAFDAIYVPGWIVMGAILRALSFVHTSYAVLVLYHVLSGLALSSFSVLGASLFSKAQLSGITVTMVCVVLAIVAQVAGPFGTGATAVLSLLFPSMNYVFFVIYLARFERVSAPGDLARGAPSGPSSLPGFVFWIFLVVQVVLYPLLGALVERWLYGTVSKERKMTTSSTEHAVVLSHFSKHWTPSWFRRSVLGRLGVTTPETVYAVRDLSIKVRRGQIMVLLGANGSGKSTTLDAISGLNTITSGSIEIDGTGGLGLCPQKNVMWDELTVFEHVKIFNELKSPAGATDSRDRIEDLIRACDLGHKIHARSSTLSGGQKRKLQLAMMFTGGSRVCCVDEVSSGLDPLSRRKIWDILLAERGERSFLLTTHFLDEADVLSDYVAILSRGRLKTKGTSVQLKHEVGVGYRISVPKTQGFVASDDASTRRHEVKDDKVVYWFPDSTEASRFLGELRSKAVRGYDIQGPTLEDVFLALAEEVRENGLENELALGLRPQSTPEPVEDDGKPAAPSSSSSGGHDGGGVRMSPGMGTSLARQTLILIHKRFTVLKRNYLPYAAAVLVPVITAGLVTLFLEDFSAVGCNPGDQSSNPSTLDLGSLDINVLFPLGPASLLDVNVLANVTGLNASSFHLVDTLDEFNDYISANFHNVTPGGFFLQPNNAQGPQAVMAYIGNGAMTFGLVTLNALSNVLEQTSITTSYQSFAVPFAPGAGQTLQLILYFGLAMSVYPAFFALYPCMERVGKVRALHYSNGIRAGPLWTAYLTFDFLFVLVVSAVSVGIFVGASDVWYAPGYLFVVFFLYGLTSILLVYVVSLFTNSQLACFAIAAGGQAVLFLLYFIMYMSILTYSPAYRVSSDLTTAHFAYSVIAPAGSMIRSLLLTLNEFSLLCRGTSVAPYPGALTVYGGPILYLVVQAVVLLTILIWSDSGYKPPVLTALSRRLRDGRRRAPTKDGDGDGDAEQDAASSAAVDPAVLAETRRVEAQSPPGTDSLRVLHLNKSFGRANHAVQDVTFGIRRGEVFALLGPNGAGKSTTISLVRGDLRPSSTAAGGGGGGGGDVLIADVSVPARRAAARRHLGVCPQFDAVDAHLTVREHLAFYAAARGVADAAADVAAALAATGLAGLADRPARALSGGGRRKLSLGVALLGDPAVLLLDEPSSGMDAAARRVAWRTLLGAAAPGRAVLVTTHSMEEAGRLATRVGILRRRMLAVGTPAELGARWGEGVAVQVVLRSAPGTPAAEMARVRAWLARRVAGVEFEAWGAGGGAHGLLRFRVRRGGTVVVADGEGEGEGEGGEKAGGDDGGVVVRQSEAEGETVVGGADETLDTAGLIELFEAHRDELGIEYYSVSPTTLDEVFLRVVGREEEEDREGAAKRRRWWAFWE